MSGVVGASLSERIVVVLGLANLLADGFSMGASNYLARRSTAPGDVAGRRDALRHGAATALAFVVVGTVPLLAYLVPVAPASRFPAATALAALALFSVGASRTFVTKAGFARSGLEMLLVGAAAGGVAYGIGALAAGVT